MKILYRNRLKDGGITCSTINPMYSLSDLYHQWLYKAVKFNGNTAVLNFAFNEAESVFCEAIAVCNTNAYCVNIKLFNNAGAIFYEKNGLVLKGSLVDIFEIEKPQEIAGAEITLIGAETLFCGYIYIGDILKLPNFIPAPAYNSEFMTEGNRSMGGQVYGLKGEILKSWSFAFRQINNDKRLEIERYIEEVQYIEPHIIKPYDSGVEPIYATLTKAGAFTKEKRDGFFWQTNLEYKEGK